MEIKEKESDQKELNWFQRNTTSIVILLLFPICFLGKAFLDLSDALFQFILGSGLFTWLTKALGDQHFKKELEIHKYKLKLKYADHQAVIDGETKRHEANLKLNGDKAISLYLKRIEIMSELYEYLSKAEYSLHALTRRFKEGSSEKDLEEKEQKRLNDCVNAINNFSDYYEGKKIYFSQETCELINSFQKKLNGIYSRYIWKYKFKSISSNMEAFKASEDMDKQIPPILKNIEKEFRELLGVIEQSK